MACVGCMNFTKTWPDADQARPDPIVAKAEAFKPPSAAGVEVKTPPAGGPLWTQLISSRAFSARPDPFALQPKERAFETGQTGERLYSTYGWRSDDFTPQVEVVVIPTVEPQPYRRLAGVIVGDSVLALIDMGDGQLQLIRPGQQIGGWTVASIDADKAILTRQGNVLPHSVTVRLEEPNGGGGGGNRPGGGAPGGGRPGGGPPGAPSSPPGGPGGGNGPGIG
jgi:hypothetical protein